MGAIADTDDRYDEELLPFLCECGDVGCDRCVPLTRAEYRELPVRRPRGARAPGHGGELAAESGDGD